MKKYILAICCMAFAGQTFAQVKTYFVHKKDGTTVELPVGTKTLDFSGKAVVNDDDYTVIEGIEILEPLPGGMPSVVVRVNPFDGRYGVELEEKGIYISKEDEPDAVRKILVDMAKVDPYALYAEELEFNTSYKCRAFVTYRGKEYYSREHSFHIDKPTMAWYQLGIPENMQAAGIYVYPTEAAWEGLYAKEPSFYAESTSNVEIRTEVMNQKWKEYLTEEKARTLSAQCKSAYDCKDGTIYLLDEIGEEFVNLFHQPFETSMYGEKGLMELDNKTTGPDTVVCSASFNVPGNTYYEFSPTGAAAMPSVTYLIDQPLLVGKEYEVEIVMAPDAENDTLPLPSSVRINYLNGGKTTTLEKTIEVPAETCQTLKYVFSPAEFAQNAIEVASRVTTTMVNKKTHTRDIRIAIIRVRPAAEE